MNFNLKVGHFLKCLIAVVFCFIIIAFFTYKPLYYDGIHATMSIETSTGVGKLYESVNGSQRQHSGEELALKNKVKLTLPKGEYATIHFECPQCGYNITKKVEAPYSELFECNCPDESKSLKSRTHKAREYIAVEISTK